jgi:L-serine dehydratase
LTESVKSIFNDVLGPVMVGASSSHVAAAARIGRIAACCLTPDTVEVRVEFCRNSALAYTYHSHGSDIGFASGLIGLPMDDLRVPDAVRLANETIPLRFVITEAIAGHPNNYLVRLLRNDGSQLAFQAISTGGGMIDLWEFSGVPLHYFGDRHLGLLVCRSEEAPALAEMASGCLPVKTVLHSYGADAVVELAFHTPPNRAAFAQLPAREAVLLTPVVPILSQEQYDFPFSTCEALDALIAAGDGRSLSDFAIAYESARGGISGAEVLRLADEIFQVMESACAAGQEVVHYENRILGSQAYRLNQKAPFAHMELITDVVRCITAVMESKSAMRPIVAAPTAGACGCLAGTLCALGGRLQFERGALVRALLAAGLVGVFFSDQATFAAEVGGCQMECGAASGMAAAAAAELFGGTAQQCLAAASMALQGVTGLACDPVAGRVESPCLNKNVMAGVNALASATMAMANFQQVIPLSQTIDAIYEIGKSLPQALRCTHGGLGLTRASADIQAQLDARFPPDGESSGELR